MPQPTLLLEGVDKTYPDGTAVLRDIDLAVGRGEFVSVVGPSGCGKSSLLRLTSGLSDVTGGTITCTSDRIAYVFQDATLLPWRDVRGNVELALELDDVDRRVRRERVAEAIELVGLGGFEKHLPHQLSGGMRMRVSIARAITLKPELFLFDEPFGALDEMTRTRLNEEILSLFRSEQFCALFVTHSITEAVYLSTRVVVLSAGPGPVRADIAVPFDYPRPQELRYTPEFAEISGQVSRSLRGDAS
jgi:NitT/TauT family transport system ATP-binding protein